MCMENVILARLSRLQLVGLGRSNYSVQWPALSFPHWSSSQLLMKQLALVSFLVDSLIDLDQISQFFMTGGIVDSLVSSCYQASARSRGLRLFGCGYFLFCWCKRLVHRLLGTRMLWLSSVLVHGHLPLLQLSHWSDRDRICWPHQYSCQLSWMEPVYKKNMVLYKRNQKLLISETNILSEPTGFAPFSWVQF